MLLEKSLTLALFGALFAPIALADNLDVMVQLPESICMDGCLEALSATYFKDMNLTGGYYAYCTSPLWLVSAAGCGQQRCSNGSIRAGWESKAKDCKQYGKAEMAAYDSVKDQVPADLPVVDVLHALPTTIYNTSILPDEQSYRAGYRTLVSQHRVSATLLTSTNTDPDCRQHGTGKKSTTTHLAGPCAFCSV